MSQEAKQDTKQDTKAETAEFIRALVEMRGLGRTFALYPDVVAAAFERGRRPIGAFPTAVSPLTEPASRFSAVPGTEE
jgi:hypothetical protein